MARYANAEAEIAKASSGATGNPRRPATTATDQDTGKGERPLMATVTKPRTDPDDILRRVEEDGVEFIRFWFTDIIGQLKSFAVGREELEGALAEGMGFDGSSITGFNRIEESDMIAMPDPDTYAILPWRTNGHKGNVARRVLRRAEAGRRALRGRPALRDAPGPRPRGGDGLRHLQHRAGARVLLLRQRRGRRGRSADDPRQGRLLRPDDARRGLRPAPRHRQCAEDARDPGRVHAPRGRARRSTRSTCATPRACGCRTTP